MVETDEGPIIRAVADTHAVLWWLYAEPFLSEAAYDFMESIDAVGDLIAISSITLVEVVYLAEKGRIRAESLSGIMAELNRRHPTFVEIAVDWRVAETLKRVDRAQIPDMPDRIIAATAVLLEVTLITRDERIRRSTVHTLW